MPKKELVGINPFLHPVLIVGNGKVSPPASMGAVTPHRKQNTFALLVWGKDAMRITALAVSTVVLFSTVSIGCKSAPKMAWWKNSDAEKVAATEAPALPSEVAQQASNLAGADPVQISSAPAAVSGGAAPAFTTSPSGYPDTGAPSYVPATGQVSVPASNSPAAMSQTMPYDPSSVPAPNYNATTSVAQSTAVPAATSGERYGASAAMGATSPATAYPAPQAASGYTGTSMAAQQDLAAAAASPEPKASGVGSRYAQSAIANTTQQTAPYGGAESNDGVQPASAVASTQPYRPGGTSSYPGSEAGNASYEVATRTDASGQPANYGTDSSYRDSSSQYR